MWEQTPDQGESSWLFPLAGVSFRGVASWGWGQRVQGKRVLQNRR